MPRSQVSALRCPRCAATTVNLMQHSSDADRAVYWLRCTACGNIWTTPKSDGGKMPDEPVPSDSSADR